MNKCLYPSYNLLSQYLYYLSDCNRKNKLLSLDLNVRLNRDCELLTREKMMPTPSDNIQWGKKVFSQPPIVQVLPLKKMREACNFHYRYTSTMRDKIRKKKSRKSHCRIFKEFICKLWWKISIWSITKFHLNTLLYTLCWQ